MKRISCFLFLSIFLASCADAVTPIQTPALTATAEAAATFTPTNTPKPTETPNPLEGAPDGATGKNAKGEWIMKKDGKEYTQETIKIGTESLTIWSTSHVEEGVMNHGNSFSLIYMGDPGNSDAVPGSVRVKHDISNLVPMFKQTRPSTSYDIHSLNGTLWYKLLKNRIDKSLDQDQFWAAIHKHDSKGAIEFTTPDGVKHTWVLYEGYEFTWLSWDDMEKVGSYWETIDETDDNSIVFRWTITTTPDGTLRAIGAVEHPEQLNPEHPEQIFKLVLGPMYKAVTNETKFEDIKFWGTMVDVISDTQKPGHEIVDLEFSP